MLFLHCCALAFTVMRRRRQHIARYLALQHAHVSRETSRTVQYQEQCRALWHCSWLAPSVRGETLVLTPTLPCTGSLQSSTAAAELTPCRVS